MDVEALGKGLDELMSRYAEADVVLVALFLTALILAVCFLGVVLVSSVYLTNKLCKYFSPQPILKKKKTFMKKQGKEKEVQVDADLVTRLVDKLQMQVSHSDGEDEKEPKKELEPKMEAKGVKQHAEMHYELQKQEIPAKKPEKVFQKMGKGGAVKPHFEEQQLRANAGSQPKQIPVEEERKREKKAPSCSQTVDASPTSFSSWLPDMSWGLRKRS